MVDLAGSLSREIELSKCMEIEVRLNLLQLVQLES